MLNFADEMNRNFLEKKNKYDVDIIVILRHVVFFVFLFFLSLTENGLVSPCKYIRDIDASNCSSLDVHLSKKTYVVDLEFHFFYFENFHEYNIAVE